MYSLSKVYNIVAYKVLNNYGISKLTMGVKHDNWWKTKM